MVEILDPRAEALLDPAGELERLADGLVFTEGPVWDFAARELTFSDIPADTMYRWDETHGLRIRRQPSNFSNGLTFDLEGRLIACEHRTRRVTRESDGGIEVVADSCRGKRLNAPNDVVVARDGSVLFTDPHYGLGEGFGGPAEQEQPVRAVFRLAPGGSEPIPLLQDFEGPNGLALSPDQRLLYVDDTEAGHVRRFRLGPDWTLSDGQVILEPPDDGEGVLDGMKVDSEGNVWCAGPGGIWIASSEGELLGRIRSPEVAANLAWGGDDASTLYITASTGLYRIDCRVRGYVTYLHGD
jgi:gluconolactonase